MSNDFALGLPLLQSMYPEEMTRYLYVAAPISFLWLNVIGFSMMEYSNSIQSRQTDLDPSEPVKKRSRFLVVFVGVIKNPVIFMTLLGVFCNVIFQHQLSRMLAGPFDTLGKVFGGGALVLLGMSMANKIFFLRGTKLITALLLIMSKTVLLPVITKALMNIFAPEDDYSADFAFLMATFPSAPGVLAFSLQYGIQPTQIAAMVVLCTILSAPIMFFSAKLIDIPTEESKVSEMTGQAATFMGSLGIVGSSIVVLLYLINRRYRYALDRAVLAICVCTIFYSVAEATCDYRKDSVGVKKLRHSIAHFGWISTCLWLLFYATILHASLYKWKRSMMFINNIAPFIILAIAVTLTVIAAYDIKDDSVELAWNYECYYVPPKKPDFGYIFAKIALPVITLIGIVAISSTRASFSTKSHSKNCNDEDDDDDELTMEDETNEEADVAEFSPLLNPSAVELNVPPKMTNKLYAVQFKHNIYLAVEVICLGLAVGHACLSFGRAGGPKYELNFIDVVMNASRGTFLFFCFATEEQLWSPIMSPIKRLWRQVLFRTEVENVQRSREWFLMSLDSNVDLQAECLLCLPLLHRDREKLECTQKYGLRAYKKTFMGKQLVDWMLENGIAANRTMCVKLGRSLLLQGCFNHVKNEHHFYDNGYFYRFEDLDAMMKTYHCRTLKPIQPNTDCEESSQ